MTVSPFIGPVGVVAAALGIVQGLVWIILTLMAMLVHLKVWTPEASQETYGRLLTSEIVNSYLNGDISVAKRLGIELFIGQREFFTWITLCFAVSVLWTAVSCYLLWVILREKFDRVKKTYLAWALWTMVGSVCDLFLASLLASDYSTIVGRINSMSSALDAKNTYTILACGVVMTLAARGFVLWIVNLTFAILVMKLSVDTPKKGAASNVSLSTPADASGPQGWLTGRRRSNSFDVSSFGTVPRLPRLPLVQSSNNHLARRGRHSLRSPNSFNPSSSPPQGTQSTDSPTSRTSPNFPLPPALRNHL